MSTKLTKPKSLRANGINRPISVFIVDDHALIRHGLSQLVSDEPDMEVCGAAEDADEAMAKLAESQPDVLVVDISLQRGNGLDLIKRVKSHHPHVKILVSSMHDESLFAERALHAGALGYVNKREATEKVIDAIRQVLQGEVYLSTTMTGQLLHRLTNHHHDSLKHSSIETLSDRELEVFEMIGQGMSSRQIADALHLSIKTIVTHREHIKDKLGLKSSAEITKHAVQWTLENS